MDIKILEDIGLTKSEIEIYLTLLELGSSNAGKILNKSGLHSSVVHRALNSLIEKGIVNYIFKNNKKSYQATDPENFLDYIDEKKEKFKRILPELKSKQEHTLLGENATIYKGKRGITKVYNFIINSKGDEYLTFGGGRACLDLMGDEWWSIIHSKRIQKKIPARQIWNTSIKEFLKHNFMKTKLTKIKFISEKFSNFQETLICGDLVAITLFTDNPYSIFIKDPKLAEGYKKHFELLWKNAK